MKMLNYLIYNIYIAFILCTKFLTPFIYEIFLCDNKFSCVIISSAINFK